MNVAEKLSEFKSTLMYVQFILKLVLKKNKLELYLVKLKIVHKKL